MSTKDNVKDYGQAVGVDCVLLRTYGATSEQVANYVKFNQYQIPDEYLQPYWTAISMGGKSAIDNPGACEMLNHPIYEAYRQKLKRTVSENWACIRSA